MITVYGKEGCSYCTRAKLHLDSIGVEYIEKLLNRDFSRETFLDIYPNAKTFPQIVEEDGTVIGGYDQLVVHDKYKKSPKE